ncbi:MAG: hypothetical protein QOK48_3455 [Blastocatellia bacterium]|nr:hypothetical protein [Blastocatellia bacterium]
MIPIKTKAIHEVTRNRGVKTNFISCDSWIAFLVEQKQNPLSVIYSTVTFSIFTSDEGRSLRSVSVVAIALTTSCPSVTRPKIV